MRKLGPVLLCFLTIAWSCTASPNGTRDGGNLDAGSDTGGVADTGDATPQTGDAQVIDTDSDGDTGFNPSPWLEEPGDCGSATEFDPVSSEPFAKPDNPDIRDRFTAGEMVSGVRSGEQSFSVLADNKHEPTEGISHATLYENAGEDLEFHIGVVTNYDDLSPFQVAVTAMVDYEPVKASYVRLEGDRQSAVQRWDDVTGVGFQVEEKVELVDIRIPAEALQAGRMNEVSIALYTHTVQKQAIGTFHRFPVFYGGWERPDRPCLHSPESREVTQPEKDIEIVFGGPAYTFFEFDDALDLRERKQVSPGETVRIYTSLRAWPNPKEVVMVPVLNGKPQGPVWWAEQSQYERGSGFPARAKIDARRHVDVKMPEEPGVYNFQVLMWPDPYEIRNYPDGTVDEDVDTDRIPYGSNGLTFEVTE